MCVCLCMCVRGGAQRSAWGKNKFPWVVAAPCLVLWPCMQKSQSAKSRDTAVAEQRSNAAAQQQRMRCLPLLTHKFNVCASLPPTFDTHMTNPRQTRQRARQQRMLLSLYLEFHMNFAKITFE